MTDTAETASPEAVRRAVQQDHPTDGCPNTCDIAAALREGFPHVAAHLLTGATEAPTVERLEGTIYGANGEPEGWQDWYDWATTWSTWCAGCGAYAYPTEYWGTRAGGVPEVPEECGNCGDDLPTVVLHDVSGIALSFGTDRFGNRWQEFKVDPLAMQEPGECETCGEYPLTEGFLCLDGGEEVCKRHVRKGKR